jgi:outer membrane protein assembly factor BamB
MLHCLSLEDGTKRWSVDTQKNFHSPQGFFGRACSPLLEGDALMLNIGGENGSGIVAFHQGTGKMLWKATDEEASYSSPAAATVHGLRRAFFYNRNGLVILDPATGQVGFTFPWRPDMNASVNAATPLIRGNEVFVSTSYGKGAVLLRLNPSGLETVWASDEALSSHYSTGVLHDGHLYGFHGRQEQGCVLRCVAWSTGKVLWEQRGLGAGTVTLADGHLLILTERGQLIRVPASPGGYRPEGETQILGFQSRAYPALAGGRFYARDKSHLVCVDLR